MWNVRVDDPVHVEGKDSAGRGGAISGAGAMFDPRTPLGVAIGKEDRPV